MIFLLCNLHFDYLKSLKYNHINNKQYNTKNKEYARNQNFNGIDQKNSGIKISTHHKKGA